MNKTKIVSSPRRVLTNIARFEQEVEQSSDLQNRLAYARAWYADRDENGKWRFGPSKFVGYEDLDAAGYIATAEDRDGRRTEAQLQVWFTAVDPSSALHEELSAALFAFLGRYGKVPSTKMRLNVLREVNTKKTEPVSMAGSIAANLHEGSRSEYLAQFVFSSFGTAIPVPHQEDSGLDIYCTLLAQQGQRAWPRAYYSVQVKSTMAPWIFGSPESVRWIIEHPLPIFLCIVQKLEARILVYHTTPRFAVWALPTHPDRLELIPGTETKAHTVGWVTGDTFKLEAPILNFTLQEVLDRDFRAHVADVLSFWIDYDVENLFRIKSGIHQFRVPADYETNTTKFTAWTGQGGNFREESLPLAQDRLRELMGHIATHYYRKNDMVNAAIYAMALRQLSPKGWSGPWPFDPHNPNLHTELNKLFGMEPPSYLYQACDSLLKMVKDELARHGIAELPLPSSEAN